MHSSGLDHVQISAPSAKRQAPSSKRLSARIRGARILSIYFSLALMILSVGCGLRAGGPGSSASSRSDGARTHQQPSKPRTLLTQSTSRRNFGVVPRGGRHEATVWLSNDGAETVEVTEVGTSCGCFRVKLGKKSIAPGGRIKAVVKVDFTDDPHFTGSLGLQAEGIAKDTTMPAFLLRVDVDVK